MWPIRGIGIAVLITVVVAAPARADAPPAKVAALQVALQALHLYRATSTGSKARSPAGG